ncbi:unnamed protein product [Owenia fusiformis]|uniref:NTR domain-containing protein n=1 Tax=Owenia fusiformis TaxID=6347 RepID=A0A8S4MWN0_OWEFU|nr:unnamed protein product [Owenia fusiformis]
MSVLVSEIIIGILFVFASLRLDIIVQCLDECDCPIKHPQQHFCEADFVILAVCDRKKTMFLSATEKKITYSITTETILKGKDALANIEQDELTTISNNADCETAVMLETGQKYVITGKIDGDKLILPTCSWSISWKDTSMRQKRKLSRNTYGENCKCVDSIQSVDIDPYMIEVNAFDYKNGSYRTCSNNTATCPWILANDSNVTIGNALQNCYAKHSVCRPRQGVCRWSVNVGWAECMQDVRPCLI